MKFSLYTVALNGGHYDVARPAPGEKTRNVVQTYNILGIKNPGPFKKNTLTFSALTAQSAIAQSAIARSGQTEAHRE
jgi:hypothetical protein